MARIRSIKPEFWRDDKIADLPNQLAALFFIGLWNFADDEGKFQNNPRALSLQMPIFRTKDILVYLRDLSQAGLIQFSECSQWVLITNWRHQKIDKPILPKVKKEDIQWLAPGHSTNGRDSSPRTRRKDRIGSDRKGSDRILGTRAESGKGSEPASRTPQGELIPTEKPPAETGSAGEGGTPVSRCIAEFIDLWRARYDGKYPLTGKDVGLLKALAKSLGEARLSQLLGAYFKMPDAWIVGRRHDVATLNANLSKVAAFADTGEFVTRGQVRQMDRTATTMSLMDRIKRGEV